MKMKYKNIINLPHYTSKKYPRMTIYKRAAQFAPFAALTGYSDEVEETARLTCEKYLLDEDVILDINKKLYVISENRNKDLISVVYFKRDKKKSGGQYVSYSGRVKKIDNINQEIVFIGNKKIKFDSIFRINY